jgi:DedD protein
MDRRVKERLVGASILVVLIVLIVPELLSGPAADRAAPRLPVGAPEPVRNVTVDLATSKPPEPVIEPAPASSQGAHGDSENPASDASTGGSASAPGAANAASAPGAPTAAKAMTAGAVTAAGAANAVGSANSGAASGDAAGDARVSSAPSAPLETAAPSPTSKTGTAKLATSGHGWAVQLGSFASRANADKLVRQVRAQGFGVYVLSGGSGTAARYRVRVGPMADRNAAVQAAAKLKSSGHVGSLVPPSP